MLLLHAKMERWPRKAETKPCKKSSNFHNPKRLVINLSAISVNQKQSRSFHVLRSNFLFFWSFNIMIFAMHRLNMDRSWVFDCKYVKSILKNASLMQMFNRCKSPIWDDFFFFFCSLLDKKKKKKNMRITISCWLWMSNQFGKLDAEKKAVKV